MFLRARAVTAEIGASTQALYTLFGGMPGLFEAIVADGFTASRAMCQRCRRATTR